jgi:hypothetical protein
MLEERVQDVRETELQNLPKPTNKEFAFPDW